MSGDGTSYGLTLRDLGVLKDLARMRYLRTAQVQALHFPSRRVANRRLEILFSEGYTDRFRLPTLVGQGSSEYIYCLKEQGGEALSTLEGVQADDVQRPHRNGRPKNFFLMEHHLAINDFWIALERACEPAHVNLPRFIPEYYGKRMEDGGIKRTLADSVPDPNNPGERIILIPDAMFILERAGKSALFFLEIDRGTEKITSSQYAAFQDKIEAYTAYLKSGGFKRWGEQFKGFRVLVVTNSRDRQQHLLRAATSMGIKTLMWVTTAADLTARTMFQPIWQVPGLNGAHALAEERGT